MDTDEDGKYKIYCVVDTNKWDETILQIRDKDNPNNTNTLEYVVSLWLQGYTAMQCMGEIEFDNMSKYYSASYYDSANAGNYNMGDCWVIGGNANINIHGEVIID